MGLKMGVMLPCAILFILASIGGVLSGRILFLVPLTSKSELSLFRPLAVALAERGHHVTFVASLASSNTSAMPPTWKEIIPITTQITDEDFGAGDLLQKRAIFKNKFQFLLSMDFSFVDPLCHQIFQHREFQEAVIGGDFDLALTSVFAHTCLEGIFGTKKDLPFIYLSSCQVPQWTSRLTGFQQPVSYIPMPVMEYTDEMSFLERVLNAIAVWWINGVMDWKVGPSSEKIYRKYLGEGVPGLAEIQGRASLILSNSHYALTLPRPLPPDVVEIGGLHCRPGGKLPKDLDDFLSGGKDGFIYFSLGTVSLGKSMPEKVRKVFVNVFSKLKQRVLWKYETETMTDLPKNVKLGKWLPQQDILAHPNIKLFITHGGLLSTQEATYHGTPLIGFPIGFDQDANMVLAEKSGYAIKMEILDITEENLEAAINKILKDPKYLENSKRVSTIMKEQLIPPMDKGIYWIEHVMKHKGAPYLRSASRDLNFIQYHSLDILGFLAGILLTILGIGFYLIKRCVGGRNQANSPTKKKKNQ